MAKVFLALILGILGMVEFVLRLIVTVGLALSILGGYVVFGICEVDASAFLKPTLWELLKVEIK